MKLRILGALGLTALGVIAIAGGCGSDDSGGSGGGGKDASTGGTGGTSTGGGGSGGTATGGSSGSATGGSAGTTGCGATPTDCSTCEDEYGSCVCEAEETTCFDDIDCSNIFDCIYARRDAGGPGPCLDFDAAGAACVLACADAFPAGKAKYLAYDGCVYCDHCKTTCDASEYCDAFTGAGGSGTDAATE